ncbi:hypothetical protein [Mycetohabitans sp. B46]|uniref:hypothetical protein n=1 Tax=Mycetohabitans sp. B46 TaxID=2772536 RepID=UPI00307D191D
MKWYKLKTHSAKLHELWSQSALVLLLTLACMASASGTGKPYNQVFLNPTGDVCESRKDKEICERHIYPTNGVHNEKGCNTPGSECDYSHQTGRPQPEPEFPEYWTSDWTMYRVFKNYDTFSPPYDDPPRNLKPIEDYEISSGWTVYDSTYIPTDKDGQGAMMEHYDKRCLPIFPHDNKYTCSFVSLGNKAYFLTYVEDRPQGMLEICQFSLDNHPPRRDFIKHLPYDPKQSQHLEGKIQAYSIIVPSDILFGYAFWGDKFVTDYKKYKVPQSFFFSGDRSVPYPNAPIVSQNFKNFKVEKPGEEVWQKVKAKLRDNPHPPWCCLFATDCTDGKKSEPQMPAKSAKTR